MKVTARCPYCGRLNTHFLEPNRETPVTCACGGGVFYVRRVSKVEVRTGPLSGTASGTKGVRT